jgi:hypothetical protein
MIMVIPPVLGFSDRVTIGMEGKALCIVSNPFSTTPGGRQIFSSLLFVNFLFALPD